MKYMNTNKENLKNIPTDLLKKYCRFLGNQSIEIKEIKQILDNKLDDKEGLFFVEGLWAIPKMLDANIEIITFILCYEYQFTSNTIFLVEKIMKTAKHSYSVTSKVFEKLSSRDGSDGLIIIAKIPPHNTDELKNINTVVVLDGLETPGNIGTIIRSCDGAGIDAVLICNKKSRLTNPKLIKSSMGAAFTIPILEFSDINDCIKWLNELHFKIFLADTSAKLSFRDCEYNEKTALVMGSERYGISNDWYSANPNMIRIPMAGVCDSLNVGIAASIILYEISIKNRFYRNDLS